MLLAALSLSLSVSLPTAAAGEGMWLPEDLAQRAAELRTDGFAVDPAALALDGDVTGAVVSLGGCSGSFVSPDGLVVTNHHCVVRMLQQNSTAERNLVKAGFAAASRAEEIDAGPGTFVYVTTGVRDVTDAVVGKLGKRLSDAERGRAVQHRIRSLIDTCEQAPHVRCAVSTLEVGARYQLVTRRELPDVRIVYAPPEGVGNFGGEVDNWRWPRHTGDFAFLRVWAGPDNAPAERADGNVPYHPDHWLSLADGHRAEGDPVMVIGYPGRTERWDSSAELAADADFRLPRNVALAHDFIALLQAQGADDPARALANYGRIRRLANGMKKQEGVIAGLADGRVAASRQQREAAAVAALKRRQEDPFAAIAALVAEHRRTEERDLLLGWLDRASPLMAEARDLREMATERARPDLDRRDGFRERDRSRFAMARQRAQASIDVPSDRATLRDWLVRTQALPADQRIAPVDAALAATGAAEGARIDALLDQLYAGTHLQELSARQALLDATPAELDARHDPLLDLARALAPLYDALQERGDAWSGAMIRLRPPYVAALRATGGAPPTPDANGTLRVTWGHLEGYRPADAVVYEPRTTLSGMVAKATGERPFDAPAALLATGPLPDRVDPVLDDVPVDFLSTVDITGGNSGSPTLDRDGKLSGLVFDGVYEGVSSDLALDPAVTRAVHVDLDYLRYVLEADPRADALLTELGAGRAGASR
ncbi:MAG: S46 family peptidase [Myxococcota bacterium]